MESTFRKHDRIPQHGRWLFRALQKHDGKHNTANGDEALGSNTTGNFNTTDGAHSLENNTTGSGNTANNVICIGIEGANVSNSCFIGSVFGQTSFEETAVFINSTGKLGTITSSWRFKEETKPMAEVSEGLFALKPVTFRYKKGIVFCRQNRLAGVGVDNSENSVRP